MSDAFDALSYALGALTMIPTKQDTFIVFYGEQIYSTEYPWRDASDLPDGAILYIKSKGDGSTWFNKDFTPIMINEVPEACKAWILIMGKS